MLAWITHTLLVGIQNGTVILENRFSFSGKTNHATTIQLSTCTLGHLSHRFENTSTERPVHQSS